MADLGTCIEVGCENPRYTFKTGSHSRCVEHLRPYWRAENRRRYRLKHPESQKTGQGPGRMKPGLEPTVRPSTLDIAFAAGVWEGDGSVYSPPYSVRATVAQKDPWLLDHLRDRFGGSVHRRKGTKSPAGHPWVHEWIVSGTRGRGFLMTIYKFLSPRRQEQVRKHLTKQEVA